MRRILVSLVLLLSPFVATEAARAHGGGLDSNGGHHCREAGYSSGKCSPLDSYHCHQAGCVEPGAEPQPAPAIVTTAPPPTTTTTVATTTTTAPTTTTAAPTTTTADVTTTTENERTLNAQTASSGDDDDSDESNPIVATAVLAAIGYGGYRVVKRYRNRGASA